MCSNPEAFLGGFQNTIPCSGHGFCDPISNTCVCEQFWNGKGDYYSKDGFDCQNPVLAEKILWGIAFGLWCILYIKAVLVFNAFCSKNNNNNYTNSSSRGNGSSVSICQRLKHGKQQVLGNFIIAHLLIIIPAVLWFITLKLFFDQQISIDLHITIASFIAGSGIFISYDYLLHLIVRSMRMNDKKHESLLRLRRQAKISLIAFELVFLLNEVILPFVFVDYYNSDINKTRGTLVVIKCVNVCMYLIMIMLSVLGMGSQAGSVLNQLEASNNANDPRVENAKKFVDSIVKAKKFQIRLLIGLVLTFCILSIPMFWPHQSILTAITLISTASPIHPIHIIQLQKSKAESSRAAISNQSHLVKGVQVVDDGDSNGIIGSKPQDLSGGIQVVTRNSLTTIEEERSNMMTKTTNMTIYVPSSSAI